MSFVYIVVALIVGPALGGTISQEMRPEGKRPSSLKLWLGFAAVALVVDSCIATAGWLNETMPAATLVKGGRSAPCLTASWQPCSSAAS